MLKYLMASAMIMALAAPAFAGPPTTPPDGGVAGTTSANDLALERSLGANGASIFGGRSQGAFGALQAVVAPPDASGLGEVAGPYGQVVLKDGGFNGGNSWTAHP